MTEYYVSSQLSEAIQHRNSETTEPVTLNLAVLINKRLVHYRRLYDYIQPFIDLYHRSNRCFTIHTPHSRILQCRVTCGIKIGALCYTCEPWSQLHTVTQIKFGYPRKTTV